MRYASYDPDRISPVHRSYRYYYTESGYIDLDSGGYNSGYYYLPDNSIFIQKAQKEKEMKANIPARTSMLNKLFDEDSSLVHLPNLPLELWNIVAEYEGGVESSLLADDTTNTSSWSCCNIL